MFFKENNKNEAYLDYIRGLPCLICGKAAEPHHQHRKFNDYWGVPLCREHHTELHNLGKNEFWIRYNIDIERKIIELLIEYIKERDGNS